MKKTNIIYSVSVLTLIAGMLTGCGGNNPSSSTSGSTSSSVPHSISTHTEEEVKQYMEGLKQTSQGGHLYYHYLRFDTSAASYNDWDVWSWPYMPSADEGYRFNWVGRSTTESSPTREATGDATVDQFGYAHVDIDLLRGKGGDTSQFYNGGWDHDTKKMGGNPMCYYQFDRDPETHAKIYKDKLDTRVGLQIVNSATRTGAGEFWGNDGGNLYVLLDDYKLENADGTTSYHVFVTEDDVQHPLAQPATEKHDPFDNDDGTNVTYGDDQKYRTADWTDKPLQATSPEFLTGASGTSLNKGAGVGYQIMVASFADSDGDGMGDIYGITQKLDYIKNLGVNAIWLTPIQLSDSYHGYDISDYMKVDPKFGSTVSPNAVEGAITEESAMKDYKDLLTAAHSKGMAVVMDLVLNHTSTTNEWFINSAQLNETMRGYFQWGNHETDPSHISETKFWYPYGSHCYSYYAKFGSSMPELNYAYANTRVAVETIAKNWCEIGVDGFRMDAVKHIFLQDEITPNANDTCISDIDTAKGTNYSSNVTMNINFWREINYEVKKVYPNCFFVGENYDGHAYHVAPYYEAFDSLFDFYSYFNLTSIAAQAAGNQVSYNIPASKFVNGGDSAWTPDGIDNKNQSFKFTDKWDLLSVLKTNNKYRTNGNNPTDVTGYSAIDGQFTSNHDISRSINRIAGTGGNETGLTGQNDVTTSNYSKYDQQALLTQIIQLMLPGCTWIYYGDELGMTGNLEGKDASSGYVDLAYRQPMKWKQGAKKGDGSMFCDFAITGSGRSITLDNVNNTSTVKGADEQVNSTSSHYGVLSTFAKLKSTTPALIRGNLIWEGWDNDHPFMFNFKRVLNGTTYQVIVNLGSNASSAGLTGTIKASYNNATLSYIPGNSALVIQSN